MWARTLHDSTSLIIFMNAHYQRLLLSSYRAPPAGTRCYRMFCTPIPTLTKTLDQYVVLTLNNICALVTLQGITIKLGFEPIVRPLTPANPT